MTAYFLPNPLPRRRFLRQSLALVATQGLSTIAIAQTLSAPINLRFGTGTTSFPNASNTGVPAGTTLSNSGSIQTTSNGQVIENLNITGGINVRHANVTIRKCKVTGIQGWAVIQTDNESANTLVENCTIDGLRRLGSYGIAVRGTVRQCNIYGVENGLNPQSDSLYQDNYVHQLNPTGTDPHSDACPMQGGISNVIVRHNTLDIDGATGLNAHIFINSYFGKSDNILIDNNLMIGVPAANQGFNIYSYREAAWASLTNIRFTNNRIKPGPFGVFSKQTGQAPGRVDVVTEWTNNVNENTGAVIPKPV